MCSCCHSWLPNISLRESLMPVMYDGPRGRAFFEAPRAIAERVGELPAAAARVAVSASAPSSAAQSSAAVGLRGMYPSMFIATG